MTVIGRGVIDCVKVRKRGGANERNKHKIGQTNYDIFRLLEII